MWVSAGWTLKQAWTLECFSIIQTTLEHRVPVRISPHANCSPALSLPGKGDRLWVERSLVGVLSAVLVDGANCKHAITEWSYIKMHAICPRQRSHPDHRPPSRPQSADQAIIYHRHTPIHHSPAAARPPWPATSAAPRSDPRPPPQRPPTPTSRGDGAPNRPASRRRGADHSNSSSCSNCWCRSGHRRGLNPRRPCGCRRGVRGGGGGGAGRWCGWGGGAAA